MGRDCKVADESQLQVWPPDSKADQVGQAKRPRAAASLGGKVESPPCQPLTMCIKQRSVKTTDLRVR